MYMTWCYHEVIWKPTNWACLALAKSCQVDLLGAVGSRIHLTTTRCDMTCYCQWAPREFQIKLLLCFCMSNNESNPHSVVWMPLTARYGEATISRLLKIVCLFCKRALWKRLYSAKEIYDFKEPTNRSHPILSCLYTARYYIDYIQWQQIDYVIWMPRTDVVLPMAATRRHRVRSHLTHSHTHT